MAQNYKITHYDTGKEPFIDRNSNQWVNVLFEGYANEQIKWVMRPESVSKYKIGDEVYGRLEIPEGKNYKRFYKEQKPDYTNGPTTPPNAGGATGKYTPNADQQESIARSVALKASVDSFKSTPGTTQEILNVADLFLAWLTKTPQPEKSNVVQSRKERDNQDPAIDDYINQADDHNEPLPEFPEDM